MKVYFGHPVNTYHTTLERKIVQAILDNMPSVVVENPNQPQHEEAYQRYKKEYGNGMKYYFEEVLPSCDAGVFLPFRDGKFGAGVAKEALFLLERAKVVIRIDVMGKGDGEGVMPSPILSPKEIEALSIEETRERIKLPY